MSDPMLWVGIGGLGFATIGPVVSYARPLIGRTVSRLRGMSVVSSLAATPAVVPSRYRWSGQEISSLAWASHQIPETVTLGEFVDAMNVDDMVSETCVSLLSPDKEVVA